MKSSDTKKAHALLSGRRGPNSSVARAARDGERGSAVVEVAILLPVYTVLLLGVILLGDSTLVKQEINQAGTLYSLRPGQQTETDLAASHFGMFQGEGTIENFTDTEDTSDVFSGADIIDALERVGTGEFFVEYEITDSGLQAVTEGGGRTWQGQYADQHGLLNEPTPTLISNVLNGWMSQNESTIEYNYSPYFMEALFGDLAKSLTQRGESAADVQSLIQSGVTLSGTSTTAGRGNRQRELAGKDGFNRPIEEELLSTIDPQHARFPDYPNFTSGLDTYMGAN